jgi:cytochrome c oxidase assembly protein subunit 15
MLHRYFALAVGVLIIVLTAMAWWRRGPQSRSAALPTTILALVCLQGAFGAWTVTMKLQPAIVTAHLLGGMALLCLLVWLATGEQRLAAGGEAARLRLPAVAGLVALVAQIALGGWVSTNYAVMACPDFPLCQGRLAPPDMAFRDGFTLWRDLGMTGGDDARPIPFQALVAIHWVHRVAAVVAFAVLGWLAWRAAGVAATRRAAAWLAGLLVLQLLTGLSNVVFQWPLLLAVAHSGGAAALLGVVIVLNDRAWRGGARSERGVVDGAGRVTG